jgi:hypothetical protein
MTDTPPPTQPPRATPPRRTTTDYLVQAYEAPDQTNGGVESWVDLTGVTVPSRTSLDGILEAARDSIEPLATDGASVRLRVTKADEIRETSVALEPQPLRLKVGP